MRFDKACTLLLIDWELGRSCLLLPGSLITSISGNLIDMTSNQGRGGGHKLTVPQAISTAEELVGMQLLFEEGGLVEDLPSSSNFCFGYTPYPCHKQSYS